MIERLLKSPRDPLQGQPQHGLEAISEHWKFSTDSMFSSSMIIAFVAGMVILAGGLWYLDRRRKLRDHPNPIAVYHRAASHFGLGVMDRWLLMQIARQQGLPSPITLMMSPNTLVHHARAFAHQLPKARRKRLLVRAYRVCEKLFGVTPLVRQSPDAA